MPKFRTRPVEIEAIQFTGTVANVQALWDWAGADVFYGPTEEDPRGYIETLEGRMTATPGDWIIRGLAGEFYPCKPEIFAAKYAEVGTGFPTPQWIEGKVGTVELTVVQRIEGATAAIDAHRGKKRTSAAREYSLAITALEDAQRRFTRGYAKDTDRFHPADLEALDADDVVVDKGQGVKSPLWDGGAVDGAPLVGEGQL